MNIDDPDHPGDKLLQLLRDNEIDLNVVEGLRLVVAFRKIRDPVRRVTYLSELGRAGSAKVEPPAERSVESLVPILLLASMTSELVVSSSRQANLAVQRRAGYAESRG